jgi:protoporphyrinogen oxidase
MDLIVGAGISGLSYANFCGHEDYLIVEKDSSIGGYCKTIKNGDFTWDYSGHFFHFRNADIKEYLISRMRKEDVLEIMKRTQIKYKNKFVDFPFQKNIHQLPKKEFIDCLYELFAVRNKDYSNFKEMVNVKFGKAIAEKFLIPYNEKLYATDLNRLDVSAMGRFFPYADREEIIRNFRKPFNSDSYNSTFAYPRGGAIEYVNSLYGRIDSQKVSLQEKLVKIDLKSKVAKTSKREIKFDRLISTMPFPLLLDVCNVFYDKELYSWNKVLVFNLGFDKKGKDTVNHWIYFPEKKYSFYRVGYYDNILNTDKLSIYVEIGLEKEAKVNSKDYLGKVLDDLRIAGIIDDHTVVAQSSVIMDPAYVHINQKCEVDKQEKMKFLSSHDVYSIGRYGEWTYCSIEDNILQAKNLVSKVSQ